MAMGARHRGGRSIFEIVDTQFLVVDLEADSWLRKIEMTSISAPI